MAHWATVHHLQTRLDRRGRGVGSALLGHLREVARDEWGCRQLRLAVRADMGLERFYGRLGWRETGRRPGALRLADDDERDEVLILLAPL